MRSLFARGREEGTTSIEFAIVAPIVLLLLLGILDFGRALNAYVTVGNAAREGLRYAARHPSATADIAGEVRSRSVPLDTSQLTVTVDYTNDDGATWVAWTSGGSGAVSAGATVVRVVVSYPWSAVTTLVGAFFVAGSGSATFTASSTGFAEANR
jgi:Flp pilus assembly protein TadG